MSQTCGVTVENLFYAGNVISATWYVVVHGSAYLELLGSEI